MSFMTEYQDNNNNNNKNLSPDTSTTRISWVGDITITNGSLSWKH